MIVLGLSVSFAGIAKSYAQRNFVPSPRLRPSRTRGAWGILQYLTAAIGDSGLCCVSPVGKRSQRNLTFGSDVSQGR